MVWYTGVDQQRYDAGNKYVPMDRFLLNYQTPTTVTPDVVPTSTSYGIPTLYPYVNMGGGEGGDNSFGPTESIDESTTSDDFGLGLEGDGSLSMSDEEKEAIADMNNPVINKAAIAKIGLSSFFGPSVMFSTAYRERKKAEAQALEQAQRAATTQRAAENQAAGTGGYQSSWGGGDGARGHGGDFMGGSGTAADMGSFADGGLASMLGREGFKTCGRQDRMGGTMEQTSQELRDAAPDQFGGGMTIGHGGGDNQNNTTVVPETNYIDVKPDLVRKDPYVNLSVMSPLEIAKLQATLGYRNIFDNDDLSVEGDLTTNIGPVNTITQFTEDGIGNTDINWGNFSTTIDPNKTIQNIGYNNSWNGIDYGINYGDGNTMFNVGTTFKNGGLASIL